MDIEITKEEATKDLNVALSEEEFLNKTSIPKDIAVLVFVNFICTEISQKTAREDRLFEGSSGKKKLNAKILLMW